MEGCPVSPTHYTDTLLISPVDRVSDVILSTGSQVCQLCLVTSLLIGPQVGVTLMRKANPRTSLDPQTAHRSFWASSLGLIFVAAVPSATNAGPVLYIIIKLHPMDVIAPVKPPSQGRDVHKTSQQCHGHGRSSLKCRPND